MSLPAITDVTSAQIETLEKEMQILFEESDNVSAKVKKSSKVKTVSRYLYRIPHMLYRGGALHKISANNSSLGKGTGMVLGHLTAGYITTARAYRFTREQENTSGSTAQSTIDVVAETVAHAIEDAGVDDDIALHTDGTGILTNASSAQTTTVLTFAGATDTLGVNRLREGMVVDVWKSDLTVDLSVAMSNVTITAIDYTAKTVTLDQAVTGANSQTNVLTIQGLETYGPATPTAASSTWPDKTVAGGLGGDSYRHGMGYVHSVTGTDYYLGKLRSSVPQLNSNRVNASNGGITFDHGQLMIDQLIQRRSVNNGDGLFGVTHMSQRAAIQKLGTTINNVFIDRGATDAGKSKDLLPTNHAYDDTPLFCGIPLLISKRQDKAKIDFIYSPGWFRAELHPIRFYTDRGGNKFFEGRGTDGTVQTFTEFFVEASYDMGSMDPGRDGVIDTLAIPTGW